MTSGKDQSLVGMNEDSGETGSTWRMSIEPATSNSVLTPGGRVGSSDTENELPDDVKVAPMRADVSPATSPAVPVPSSTGNSGRADSIAAHSSSVATRSVAAAAA